MHCYFIQLNSSKIDTNRGSNVAFEKGREKTGGRKAGTRNKVNLFNQETIEEAKAVIAGQVAKGDIEAAKLVLSYSLSKPVTHKTGVMAELEQAQARRAINNINKQNELNKMLNI